MPTSLERNLPPLNPGDLVWLSTRHLNLSGPRKFKPWFLGPFRILCKVGSLVYHLELPSSMWVHTIFHVSLLKKAHSSLSHVSSTPRVTEEGGSSPRIKRIIDSHEWRNQVWYLVSWMGRDSSDNSWELASSIHEPRLEHHFHMLFPRKPWSGGLIKAGGELSRPTLPHHLSLLDPRLWWCLHHL